MCVNLAVEVVNVPYEGELLDRGFDLIVCVDQDNHACYYEAANDGEACELKIVLDEDEESIYQRVEGFEDWNLVDYIH
ncbi:hypothetical protein [Halobacillus sp. H74]|uniref:hypothetical protein n=1 Tax=Halobacillus sp. H74 TaxID=3457436 RepID=UPI003FCC6987